MDRPRQADGRLHGVIVGCPDPDGRWLLIRRAAQVSAAPLKICFPGGAMEPGENKFDAGHREMQEELGVEVDLLDCVWRFDDPTRELTLWGWLGKLKCFDLRPDAREVAEVLWLDAEEIRAHPDLLINSELFVTALQENLGRWPDLGA